MVIVDDGGGFLSQREYPRMALIETILTDTHLRLKAPGMLLLEVPLASEGGRARGAGSWNDRIAALRKAKWPTPWVSAVSRFAGTADALRSRGAASLQTHVIQRRHVAPYKFAVRLRSW